MVSDDLQLVAFGVTIHLRLGGDALCDLVQDCLLPGWTLTRPNRRADVLVEVVRLPASERESWQVRAGGEDFGASGELTILARALDQAVHMKVAELSPEAIFLHAGVVEWQGQAIVIPGRSMTGKSTLTCALVSRGATYYSDEFAPILPDGRVMPYPKSLSVRRDGAGAEQLAPPSLGWREGLPAIPICTVAAVRFRGEGHPVSISEASRAEAAAAMLDNAVSVRNVPERALRSIAAATRKAICLAGSRPEAGEFADLLLETVRGAAKSTKGCIG